MQLITIIPYLCRVFQHPRMLQYPTGICAIGKKTKKRRRSGLRAMLQKLMDYDPANGVEYATYIFPFILNAMLRFRMGEENENGTAEIVRLADWDTLKTKRFANKAIAYLLNCENEKLPKETMIAFEL